MSPELSGLASFVRAIFELQAPFNKTNYSIFIKAFCYYGNLFSLEIKMTGVHLWLAIFVMVVF